MQLSTTYLNGRVELFEGVYDISVQKQLDGVSRLYNQIIGPVTSLHLERPDLLDPSFYCGACNHSRMDLLIPDLTIQPESARTMSIPGGGKGANQSQPVLGALGELAERLLSILHFQAVVNQLECGTWNELVGRGYNAAAPQELPLFAPEQYSRTGFPFTPFSANTPLRWIRGRRMLSGEEVLLPAQLVLLYYKRATWEPMIGYPTSGGLAFHPDRRSAILHGLYEYIERDAINVRWYCRLPPARIDLNLQDFLRSNWSLRYTRVTSASLKGIELYLNTLDIPIPIFTVLAFDHARAEGAFLGAGGAWSNRDRALRQALFELGQTRAVLNSFKPGQSPIRADSHTDEMREFLHGAIYFGFSENLSRLSWYRSGRSTTWNDVLTREYESIAAEHDSIAKLLRELRLNPIILDFTGACWPGVWVVKVVVPELTGACVAAHPFLGHPRYYDIAQSLGLADHKLSFGDLNEDPIPFP